MENIRNSDQYAHQREKSIEKTTKAKTYLKLSVVMSNLRVTCYSYDQNHIRNELSMSELVNNIILILEIAKTLNILQILNFSMAAILYFIFPPYALS